MRPLLLLVAAAWALGGGPALAQPLVLAPAEAPPAARFHPERGTDPAATRFARLDAAAFEAAVREAERGARAVVTVEVAPGLRLRSAAVWVERRGPGRLTWSGSVEGDPLGHVLLTVEGAAVVGRIATGGRTWSVGYAGSGRQVVYEVEPEAGLSCGTDSVTRPLRHEEESPRQRRRSVRRGGGEIDTVRVMLVHTVAVRETLGEAGLEAHLQHLIDTLNDVFVRTEVLGRVVRTPGVELATPSPEVVPDVSAALDKLFRADDGVFDEVHPARDEHGAALISLVTERPGYCGLAYVIPQIRVRSIYQFGFSVVRRSCPSYLFAHEIGHNLGLRHDPYLGTSYYPFPYGHGYVSLEGGENEWFRTVMSYPDACQDAGASCPVVPYFSNPDLALDGFPLGEPVRSDAARGLAASVPVAAQAYSRTPPPVPDRMLTVLEDETLWLTIDEVNPDTRFVRASMPAHGTTQLVGDTAVVYRPLLHYFGADTFNVEVAYEVGPAVSGRVEVGVEPLPDAPSVTLLTAPESGASFDLNEMDGPLAVQWNAMAHPDYPNGGAALSGRWEVVSYVNPNLVLLSVPVGDTTGVEVPLVRLDEAAAEGGGAPRKWAPVYHRVVVSDGQQEAVGPVRLLYLYRLSGNASDPDDPEDEEAEEDATQRVVTLRGPYPNPAADAATFQIRTPTTHSGGIVLYDTGGRVVYKRRLTFSVGQNGVRVPVSRLRSGLYLYHVEVGGAVFRGRVTVL